MSDQDAQAVLNLFTGCCTHFHLQRIEHLGFSGAAVWKVVASEANFLPSPLCLKRWPADHPPPARLPWIHQVLQRARQQGLEFVAEPQPTRSGSTICESSGCTWELMTWQPGEVEHSLNPPPLRVAAAFRALARFHAATQDPVQVTSNTFQPAPAFTDRWSRWQELMLGKMERIQRAVLWQQVPAIDELAGRWLTLHSQLPARLGEQLQAAARLTLPQQPAIRDLWRDHVLFTGTEVSGLIDFGAMRVDTPLTDIARLLGSLARDDAPLRRLALEAYAAVRPLSAREVELVDLLDHSGAFIAGWNWLDWLYLEQRQFPSLAAVRGRLSELLSRQW